jgi:O-antigen ligase
MERASRADLTRALLLGGLAGLSTLLAGNVIYRPFLIGTVAALVLIPLSWWLVSGPDRWVLAFLPAVLLLPPLPLPWGDAGPHPSIVVAAVGLWAGIARLGAWQFRYRPVSVGLCLLLFSLLLSLLPAALYSGAELAVESLARILLFAIAVYLFFYLADGPGRDFEAGRLVRLLFWAGFAVSVFACLDFYLQLPAPARFAEQFVWLPGGVFRRAQGLFYEASTLGLFCVFLLVMIAAIALFRTGRWLRIRSAWLIAAGVAALAALVLSFSRTSLVALGVSLVVMLWLERRRFEFARKLARLSAIVLACASGVVAILYWSMPQFLEMSLMRFWYSGLYLLEAPNAVLSRRLESWNFLLGFLYDHPWHAILGIGYKTLPYSAFAGEPLVADNTYLSLLIETGLLGLSALLFVHFSVLKSTYRVAVAHRSSEGRGLGRMLAVCMFSFWCGFAVQMLSGDVLTYWRVLPVFLALLAVTLRDVENDKDPVSGSIL